MKPLITLILLSFIILPGITLAQATVPGYDNIKDSFYDTPVQEVDGALKPGTGFVPCSGVGCSACDFVILANTLIKWLITISFLFFAVLAVITGFKLVTSGGNPSARQEAKKSFTNAFIGLIIILAAWLMVDTLMRGLVKSTDGEASGVGPWMKVACATQGTVDTKNLGITDPELPAGSPPSSSYGSTTANDPGADGVFTYQSGIAAQRVHASASLNRLLSCMAQKVPANVGQISSISDSYIVNRSKTWSQCRLGSCQHTTRSFHYGSGGQCGDKSFAVDFGDEGNVRALCAAANGCGARDCGVHNGDHVHVSAVLNCN